VISLSQKVQTDLEEGTASYSMSIGAHSWEQSGRGVRLITHLQLVWRLGMRNAVTLLIFITGGWGGV